MVKSISLLCAHPVNLMWNQLISLVNYALQKTNKCISIITTPNTCSMILMYKLVIHWIFLEVLNSIVIVLLSKRLTHM